MFTLYLISIASNVQNALAVLGTLLLIGCGVSALFTHDTVDGVPTLVKKLLVYAGIAVAIAGFIPSTQSLLIMYSANKISQSEAVKRDAPDLYDLGVKVLKQKLEEELKNKDK